MSLIPLKRDLFDLVIRRVAHRQAPSRAQDAALDYIAQEVARLPSAGLIGRSRPIWTAPAGRLHPLPVAWIPSYQSKCVGHQPPPQPAPIAFFITDTHGVDQVPLSMEAD